jgi:hypothetical protein
MAFNGAMWGVLLMCSAATRSYGGMMAVRFILGLFEAVIFAGMGLIVSMWWTRAEQPWRTAVCVFSLSFCSFRCEFADLLPFPPHYSMFSTLSSIMNGVLSYACACYTGSARMFTSVPSGCSFTPVLLPQSSSGNCSSSSLALSPSRGVFCASGYSRSSLSPSHLRCG